MAVFARNAMANASSVILTLDPARLLRFVMNVTLAASKAGVRFAEVRASQTPTTAKSAHRWRRIETAVRKS